MTGGPSSPRFVDRFGPVSDGYARWRPAYPDTWLAELAALCAGRERAWDVATGSGQAAVALAAHFREVIATDASAAQLASAAPHPRVEYRIEPAEASTLRPGSVDLVTVAQALHWLDAARFYAEVRRVAAPGGVLAVWCYGRPEADGAELSARLREFHDVELGPWWPEERRAVLDAYRSLPFPFPELRVGRHAITVRWSLDQLLGYLGTWSSLSALRDAGGEDPLPALEAALLAAWGGDRAERREVRWPLAARVGRVPG
ncbi:MAG: class I SAM-dependent methyltransferase [Polyangiaceae bacterium]|nr:class I SAM-dependent methyltransferase [Polyangiaceae bacterium]